MTNFNIMANISYFNLKSLNGRQFEAIWLRVMKLNIQNETNKSKNAPTFGSILYNRF